MTWARPSLDDKEGELLWFRAPRLTLRDASFADDGVSDDKEKRRVWVVLIISQERPDWKKQNGWGDWAGQGGWPVSFRVVTVWLYDRVIIYARTEGFGMRRDSLVLAAR